MNAPDIIHPAENLMTHTLRNAPWGTVVARILADALGAVEPGSAVKRFMQRQGSQLRIGARTYDLNHFQRVLLVGAGKAGAPMAKAAAQILAEHLHEGIIVVKKGHLDYSEQLATGLQILEGGHPLPDRHGLEATRRLTALLATTRPDDLVICLISGGGSALLTEPTPGLHLADLQMLTQTLLACGATINEINTLRKHLDQVKGGGLAKLAAPARLVTLILSDVVGDPLDVIASGPTVPDTTTFEEACHILERYAIVEKTPQVIVDYLARGARGELPETPKPGARLFQNVQNLIIGSNAHAAEAALKRAQAEGFQTLLLTTYLQGEARQVGRVLASLLRQIAASGQPLGRPACVVAGGETTVTLQGDGLGGRNQELALGAVADLSGLPDIALVTLATDGDDGPTDAAGAVVTGVTEMRARLAGLSPADHLNRNDAYHFFDPLDDLLKPGPTLTNVNDLSFLFAF